MNDDDFEYYDDKTKFTHIFEGYSIWMEIEENTTPINLIMNELYEFCSSCDNNNNGVSKFIPHVTLLYNFPSSSLMSQKTLLTKSDNNKDKGDNDDDDTISLQIHGEQLLQSCWDEYLQQQHHEQESSSTVHNLIPTEWYYFHYPKSADNGKGFGCVIAMLLIKPTDWLMKLHQYFVEKIGPDERCKDNNSKFVPHLSLIYAPESQSEFLKSYVKKQKQQSQQLVVLSSINNDGPCNNIDDEADIIADEDKYNDRCGDDDNHDDRNSIIIENNKEEGNNERSSLIMAETNSKNVVTSSAVIQDETTTTNTTSCSGLLLPVKYLSLWSTQGQIKDWYRIAKIEI